MDPRLRRSMNDYYNERAAEFDDIYTLGKPPGKVSDPKLYVDEARSLSNLVSEHAHGRLLDIPCGTGYWLQFYAANCSSITLVDQSEKMLRKCRKAARGHEVETISEFIRADALEVPLDHNSYDTVLVGVFLSHLTDTQMDLFLRNLRKVLKPAGRIIIMDSSWSQFRKSRPKKGTAVRKLNDGRTYEIYKRYFDRDDIELISESYNMDLTVHHDGQIYLGVTGVLKD